MTSLTVNESSLMAPLAPADERQGWNLNEDFAAPSRGLDVNEILALRFSRHLQIASGDSQLEPQTAIARFIVGKGR